MGSEDMGNEGTVNAGMSVEAIGRVARPSGRTDDRTETCRIVFDEPWWPCLDGVDDFSHLQVIWWFHGREEERGRWRHVHPRGRRDLPEVGLFATHAPVRPNPLALTLVRVLAVEEGALVVRGLDAWDGSPVLDVKGYFGPPLPDEEFRIPAWFARL